MKANAAANAQSSRETLTSYNHPNVSDITVCIGSGFKSGRKCDINMNSVNVASQVCDVSKKKTLRHHKRW